MGSRKTEKKKRNKKKIESKRQLRGRGKRRSGGGNAKRRRKREEGRNIKKMKTEYERRTLGVLPRPTENCPWARRTTMTKPHTISATNITTRKKMNVRETPREKRSSRSMRRITHGGDVVLESAFNGNDRHICRFQKKSQRADSRDDECLLKE